MATETDRCPHEAKLLAFFEGSLQPGNRKRIDRHIAGCGECREALTLLTGIPHDFAQPTASPEIAAEHQAACVLLILERDKARRRSSAEAVGCAPILAAIGAFLIIAGAAVAIYRSHISRSQDEEGFVALRAAVSKSRRIPLRISGGLPYAPFAPPPRGGPQTDDWAFDRAESKLSFARNKSEPPASRLALARFYLARAEPGDSEKALRLLEELQSSAGDSAEILNETGIANYLLGRYREAVSNFTKALDLDAKMPEALFNKAYAEELIESQVARRDWERFIASPSDSDWIAEARQRLDLLGRNEN